MSSPPPGYGVPQQPGHPGPQFQPPSYPPSQPPPYQQQPGSNYSVQSFDQYQQVQHGGRGGGGRRGVLAAVLGAVAALAVLFVAAIVVTSGDDDTDSSSATETTGPDTDEEDTTDSSADIDELATAERIGTTVGTAELLVGDCIDFNRSGGTVDEFDVVACDQSHAAEVSGQTQHPAAGGSYPQVDDLNAHADTECPAITEQYLGADVFDTTLVGSALVPTFDEWSAGHQVVNCTVELADGSALTQAVQDNASAFDRPDELTVSRLNIGDCFNQSGDGSAFDLFATDLVLLTDCDSDHNGFFFGRAELSHGAAEPYPDEDTLNTASIGLCDEQFTDMFGVSPIGFDYRYWSPSQRTWNAGDRAVICAILDDRGLPTTLDYSSYLVLHEAPTSTCFVLPPAREADALGVLDRVSPVDCGTEFHGQIFGAGALADGDFPGAEAVEQQSIELCDQHFADFVGIDLAASTLQYIYWSPTETSWADGGRRYACAFLSDDPYVGSFEGSAI